MDIDFLHAYSTAIRSSRTIEETKWFANHLLKNKIKSKQWLFTELSKFTSFESKNILILGSWYPTYLPYMMKGGNFTCVDIDESVLYLGEIFNEHIGQNITFVSCDAKKHLFTTNEKYDIIINTSCEHMPYDMKDIIYDKDAIYAFQSNDYYSCDEHVNCKDNLQAFEKSTGLKNNFYSGVLDNLKYNRFMVIGKIE